MYTVAQITPYDLDSGFFKRFDPSHFVMKKWYNVGGEWRVAIANEKYGWEPSGRRAALEHLKTKLYSGAYIIGARSKNGKTVGYGVLEAGFGGRRARYVNLSEMLVDSDWRGLGIGTQLFNRICEHARLRGAERLFVSVFPATDTVSFFKSLGCTDAEETIPEFVRTNDDMLMEYVL